MRSILPSLTVALFLLSHSAFSQLTAGELEDAVRKKECHLIQSALDSTELIGEQMKFHAAVCYYRNGDMVHALELFREVSQLHQQFWPFGTFWEAKIYAARGEDSIALARLHMVPTGNLNFNMLSQPEFDNLYQRNKSFRDMRDRLKPGFNAWTSLLAVIAGIGLITGILLLFGKSRFTVGEKWLATVVLSFTMILTIYLLIWTGYIRNVRYVRNLWPFLTLLVGPSLYFYLKRTFREDIHRKALVSHYAVPALGLLCVIPSLFVDFGIPIAGSDDVLKIGSSPTLLTCQLLFYAVQISVLTRNEWQVDTNIKQWSRGITIGMWVYTVAFLSYFILVSTSFFNPQWDYSISIVMGIGLLGIAYMGLVQRRVFSSEPIPALIPVQKYQSSNLTPAASESIRLHLERLLKEEQVFKENELRLDDLAAYLDITRHQLSQVINAHYHVNFFELINRFRVAYVQKALSDPGSDQRTIIQIAYEAGFNNKASFNRYFKQETGLTPSAYRLQAQTNEPTPGGAPEGSES